MWGYMVTIVGRCPYCHDDGIAVNLNQGMHFLCGNCLASWHMDNKDLYTILEAMFEDVSGQTVQAPENYDIGAFGLDPSGTYPISGEF